MWPFSSNDKESSELTKELPDSLKDFFEENNPTEKHKSVFESTPQQKRVNDILLKHENKNYSFEFDSYKHSEDPKKVTSINCAEMQQKVVECFRGWTFTQSTHCQDEINTHASCVSIQRDALNKLFYGDCVSIPQCNQIRYVVDKLFTENFGQYGDNVNEESKEKFEKELDKAFYKIWK